jgi:4-alpha-glucanotransferase
MIRKDIGTLVPLSALFSAQQTDDDAGTLASGIVFLDWLHETNQTFWQMLPFHETQLEIGSATKRVPSPYKGYGVGLDPRYLPVAFANSMPTTKQRDDFLTGHKDWIDDYTLFCALRDHFKTDDWRQWDSDIRNRDAQAIALWRKKLEAQIDAHMIVQWRLHEAYAQMRKKAKTLHISLRGDLPFYLCLQSPLVWANQSAFTLENDGSLRFVSGVPNVHQSFFGRQIWGHPLYAWEAKEQWKNIIRVWKIRIRYLAGLFDYLRLDYAKAFFNSGVIDLYNKQADGYRIGPGEAILEEVVNYSNQCGLSIFVEDNGNKIEELRASMVKLQSPGIKILRFGLDEKKDIVIGEYADVLHYPSFTVAYTTTHDTETLLGYLHKLSTKQKQRLAIAANVAYHSDDLTFAKYLRDAVIASPAHTVIIPIQDWLLITDRTNTPGTELAVNDPNWHFKIPMPIEELPEIVF